MLRRLHRWVGLAGLLLLCLLGITGAALSVLPMAERLASPALPAGLSVAELAARVSAAQPGIEQIRRAPSGRITAWWFDGDRPGAGVIDPATGRAVAPLPAGRAARWLTALHRSLFLDDAGRGVVGLGAGAMLVLSISGAVMVARRTGGWRRWFSPLRGPAAGRWHVAIARASVAGLALSSATGLWMTAETFGLLPEPPASAAPAAASGLTGLAPDRIARLADTPAARLRSLSLPAPGDAGDVITLRTDQGTATLDQGTGALLGWSPAGPWQRLSDLAETLHTGRGALAACALALLLGLSALGVPGMAATGLILWRDGWRARASLGRSAPAAQADVVILVASETGSTIGFARTLQQALAATGRAVHLDLMGRFRPDAWPRARLILCLAASWGDGEAPAHAQGFARDLAQARPRPGVAMAVLGFGDRSFPRFCGFAERLDGLARAAGWQMLMPLGTVDRQSGPDFTRWGRALGATLGIALDPVHQPQARRLVALPVISRRDFGPDPETRTAILRLGSDALGRFRPGDLLGVVPEGSEVARFYSLASGRRDGFAEIVVRRQPGGLCSGQLVAIAPGAVVRGFLRPNPAFHAPHTRAPLILIGAGTGIAPLAGIVRDNRRHRPIHLFFGFRDPERDFLYRDELALWLGDGRLTRLVTAVSGAGAGAAAGPRHVQDALRAEAPTVLGLIRAGAHLRICGGRAMAAGVHEALDDILAPAGLSLAALRSGGRIVEDIF